MAGNFVLTVTPKDAMSLVKDDGGHVLCEPVPADSVGSVTATAPLTASGHNVALQAGATVAVSVATSSALTAYAGTAALLPGALALVQSRSSLWSYQPADTSAADGNHIPAFGGGNFVYVAAADGAKLAQQAAWVIDVQNSTGLASDDNSGLTAAAPLLTKAEVNRRWGTNPVINGATTPLVTFTYLSGDTNSSDPGIFTPTLVGGAAILHTAPLPAASFTGSLLAVTAKSVAAAPGNAIASTFTTTTGAIVANMMLVNTTRGNSRAFVQRNLGGGNWQLGQPLQPYGGTGLFNAVEVNSWANGDAIIGYVLTPLNLVDLRVRVSQVLFTQAAVTCYQIAFKDFSGFNFDPTFLDGPILSIVECAGTRQLISQGGGQQLYGNVALSANLIGRGAFVVFSGGLYQPNTTGSNPLIQFGFDTIVRLANFDGGVEFTHTGVCIDGTNTVEGPQFGNSAVVPTYGSGTLNVQAPFFYTGLAATNLLVTLQLNGRTTGYSNATAAGVTTVHGGIALSGANLDAAAGAAGFGGFAWGGGATITNGTQP